MAHRTTYPVNTHKSDAELITCALVGAGGTGDLVVETNGDILTATYSATGTYVITFRNTYPQLKSVVGFGFVGTTAGLDARFTAIDVAAGTATIIFEVAAVATVLATTDTCYINLIVRNSGRNT